MATRAKTRKKKTDPAVESKKKPGCRGCPALCCHDLALLITRPRTKSEIDSIRWQLHFDTVSIFITSHRWHMLVRGRCIYLDENNLCTIYDRRPQKCRRHNPPDCERYGKYWDVMINTPEELDAYLEKERRRRARAARRRRASRRRG